jgi:hypothetical protein
MPPSAPVRVQNQLGSDLAQGPTLGVQVGCTLNIHAATVTIISRSEVWRWRLSIPQGQGSNGIDGVFLLPVLSFAPGDETLNCKTRARSVLVDLGGFVITEDNRFPESSWTLQNGKTVPLHGRSWNASATT